MEQGQFKYGNKRESVQDGDGREFKDHAPIQFVRVGMSKNGKWIFIDTVSRACVHINYVRAIDRNKAKALAEAKNLPATSDQASACLPKTKKPRKENDRTT